MKVVYSYSKIQLEEAVKFISKYNEFFIDRDNEIRSLIIESMDEMAGKFPDCGISATIGFHIDSEIFSEESIDCDENDVYFHIFVDPSMLNDSGADDIQEVVKSVPRINVDE